MSIEYIPFWLTVIMFGLVIKEYLPRKKDGESDD